MKIVPVPLTRENFAPYGDVIEVTPDTAKNVINYGQTEAFYGLADLNITGEGGAPQLRLFRTTPMPRPVQIKVMERHPLSSQAFYPLEQNPYLVVVAEAGEFRAENLRAFIAAPGQGVNYRKGTWHHYSLSLNGVSDFLVVDRHGKEKNCDEVFLDDGAVEIDY